MDVIYLKDWTTNQRYSWMPSLKFSVRDVKDDLKRLQTNFREKGIIFLIENVYRLLTTKNNSFQAESVMQCPLFILHLKL